MGATLLATVAGSGAETLGFFMAMLAAGPELIGVVAATTSGGATGTGADPQVSLTPQTRILAALIAIAFTAFVLDLIRRHHLQERYSVIWFVAGLAMLAGAAFPGLLEIVAGLMGVRDTNVALFSLILLLLLGLALNFSVIVSRQSEQVTRLAQELAIRSAQDGLGGKPGGSGPGGAAGGSDASPGFPSAAGGSGDDLDELAEGNGGTDETSTPGGGQSSV